MDNRTILKAFGEAFLRSMIVLMAIAIVGFGAFFLIRVNADSKQKNEIVANTEGEPSTYSDAELQAMLEEENANDTRTTTEEATTEEITTEEVTTEAPDIPSTDKNILVLNSTSKAGLASSWSTKLSNSGFGNVAYGNYGGSAETQTKIYVSEDNMGKDLAEYFSDAVISVGSLDSGNYSIKGGASMNQVDIFIVIGTNDTTVQ
ncbi:MAG: LytR C-terminal domain-containing protein [Lachnospiraceae bacterium]|nr:LytR C-terminal domain-containing protein [Lachnospiraceae bacterium]